MHISATDETEENYMYTQLVTYIYSSNSFLWLQVVINQSTTTICSYIYMYNVVYIIHNTLKALVIHRQYTYIIIVSKH